MLGALLSRPSRMAAYTVHAPPRAAGLPDAELAESLVFVRDGFSWMAAIFSPVYLLVRGEWRALALYLAVATAIVLVLQAIGAKPDWTGWALLLLNVVTGFEMSELRRWSLGGGGWQQIATVNGAGQDEAERRFFETWLPRRPTSAEPAQTMQPAAIPSAGAPYAIPHASTPPSATVQTQRAVDSLAARLRKQFALKP